MKRARSIAGILLLAITASAGAIEIDDILQAVLDQAFTVRIVARVTENGRETVHNYELTQVTISGRAVRLRLEGGNLTIVAEFTPYEAEDKSILLIAEGQIWLTTPENEVVQYRTSLKSIPLELGERVFFYPLGRSALDIDLDDVNGSGTEEGRLNIELEVQVEPYSGAEG
ncbi:MAG: hypothetical protein KAU31_15710 [Spirochaetaceae bacterium]|nr:hypothetical protein [Spirochaetaceae bacterium]